MRRELAGAIFVALLLITLVVASNGESSSEPNNKNLWIAIVIAFISVGISAVIGYKLSHDTILKIWNKEIKYKDKKDALQTTTLSKILVKTCENTNDTHDILERACKVLEEIRDKLK